MDIKILKGFSDNLYTSVFQKEFKDPNPLLTSAYIVKLFP